MTPTTKSLTLQDFLKLSNLEESPAWELINGEVMQKPMPTIDHSILQKRLVVAIDNADSEFEAFPELRCILQANSVVPDITVIRRDRVPLGNTPVAGAPDWTIEILSPDQSTTKLIEKIQTCLNEGTQPGWLIDSSEEVIMVFWADRPLAFLRMEDKLPVLEGITLELTVEQVFGWLRSKR